MQWAALGPEILRRAPTRYVWGNSRSNPTHSLIGPTAAALVGAGAVGYWQFGQARENSGSITKGLIQDFEAFNDWSRDVCITHSLLSESSCRYS